MLKALFERIWLFFWAHPGMRRVNLYLMNLTQKSLGINNYKSDFISGEHFWVKQVLRHYRPEVVFDVGAHTGAYADMFRKAGYAERLFLFEPHPGTYSILKNNIPAEANTTLYNLGFSDTDDTRLLFDYNDRNGNSGSSHASLFQEVITDMHGASAVAGTEVQLMQLDTFAQKEGIEQIGLLKIDTEGNEFRILKGAAGLLADDRIDVIQFEFGEMNVVSRVFFKDFYDLLKGKYRLYRLLPSGLLPLEPYNARHHEIFIYQNIVAIHRRLNPPE